MPEPDTSRSPSSPPEQGRGDDLLRASLGALRDVLSRGVLITADRIKETLDDAVRRGHLTREHAQHLADELIGAGRRQTDDVRGQIERLLRGGRSAAAQSGGRVLREVGRARRRMGPGSGLPIAGYDELTAAQVQSRLAELTLAELRRVRDHERRHANRKTVLRAIDRKLR